MKISDIKFPHRAIIPHYTHPSCNSVIVWGIECCFNHSLTLTVLSLIQKMPVVLICDDPCTYVAHSLQRYPTEAELAFGKTHGCYEKPSEDVPPRTNISCPEITPIELQASTNRDAMKNDSILVHPDVSTSKRYVFGTR